MLKTGRALGCVVIWFIQGYRFGFYLIIENLNKLNFIIMKNKKHRIANLK
jgi:hypothetical protein